MLIKNFLSALFFYLVIKPLSLLPLPILYGFSSGLFYITYYLFPYRKKVVLENLKFAFPDLSQNDRNAIAKKFFRHFIDLLIETIKVFSISEDEFKQRVKVANPDFAKPFEEKNQSIIIMAGHTANWEWLALQFHQMGDWKGMGIYKQLSNKYFDKLMVESRGRFGIELCSTKNVSNYFETHHNERIAYGFLADQNPRDKNNAYWIDFFGVKVPWAMGAEKYARQYNMPVLYGDSIKISRGYYKLEYSLITNNPSELAEGEITKLFVKKLEESILKDKPSWLWTHKRWKHAERK